MRISNQLHVDLNQIGEINNVAAVAKAMNINTGRIYKWFKNGELLREDLPGHAKISKKALIEFIKKFNSVH